MNDEGGHDAAAVSIAGGEVLFPARYRCPHCGAAGFASQDAPRGVIEETTVVRRRVDAGSAGDVCLARVRTAGGVVVIARLDAALPVGTTVALFVDDRHRVLARAAA
ncbi:DNA-binding protein [Paraburkholderia sp. J41]|uniref:DNA-binding protein n=1 Tax=Paraburkholderia sp. J41 TaxID=2805433 RepID=UPI002AC35F0B|nr:DNA-binding protein [Paraburkholderia sp. J41]